MNRYQKFINQRLKQKEIKEKQEQLHTKYSDIPEEKVIIEKSNTLKFILSFTANVIKITSEIILMILASVGIISLIYKEPRADLIVIFMDIYNTILSMI